MKSNMIYPCLWFNGNAREEADFYCSVFDDTAITSENLMVVTFESSGQKFMLGEQAFMAIDSSYMHQFSFNEAVSLVVDCETQDEIDYYWDKLT